MKRAAILFLAISGCKVRPAAAEAPPMGPGVIRGTVTFRGAPPKPKSIRGDGVPAGGLLRDDLVLDPEQHVRWAFVFVKQGLEGREFLPLSPPASLNQTGLMYDPHVLG